MQDMTSTSGWLMISVAWLVGSFGSGYLLARLYKRLHPELSLHKLWAFWTVILSVSAGLILLLT